MGTNIRWPQCERVLIVASGPSVKAVSQELFESVKGKIIAVNGAIEWLPKADYWCSVDTSPINMRRMMHQKGGVTYVMAAPERHSLPCGVIRVRRVCRDGIPYSCRLDPKNRGVPGLNESHGALNTGNSAYAALGLAYHMSPRLIVMLGVDGTQEARVEGGLPNDLRHLPRLFSTAVEQLKARGIRVVNGSPESTVTCFEKMAPDEALGLCM